MRSIGLKSSALCVAVMLASAGLANGQLINTGFEDSDPGLGAAGWDTFNDAYTATEYARTGAKSFKMFGPFFPGGGAGGQQVTTAVAGETYTLSSFALSPANDFITGTNFATMKLEFLDVNNNILSFSESIFDINKTPDVWNPLTTSGIAPAGTTQARALLVHVQLGNPPTGGAVFFDDVSLTTGAVSADPTWITDASANYFNNSNWAVGGAPSAVGATANFRGAITAPRTIFADASVTLGTINFDNANRYLLAGNGTLTMDVASGQAAINVAQGSHKINLPLVLNKTTNATVASGATLVIADPLTLANGSTLNAAGAGTVQILSTVTTLAGTATLRSSGGTLQLETDAGAVNLAADAGRIELNASQHASSVAVASGARLNVTDRASRSILVTPTLTVATGGTLDLADNVAIVNYTGSSPATALRTALAAGAAGNFAGTGLISSLIPANSKLGIGIVEASAIGSPTSYLGEAIDSTTVLIRTTLKGDTDLSGSVNFTDLLKLAQSYGLAGTWVNGDSTYDGNVNFADLLALAQNYGQSFTVDASSIAVDGTAFAADFQLVRALLPEPASLTALLGVASVVGRRRRA